ncbi:MULTISPECIES: hypothetical protein [Vagococcus]|uniref:Extracellular protein n=1 Tax=Vagococcus fluvialis bH819 TaxID=1255619 RepID=A0A1X6WTI1_9ENTE|nr:MULTISPECIES: hypothetical protein [Vagococcus]SLM86916.1 hypothetical protein FM121_12515 [Vagococcus fluvialis bH819]HCM88627.1 hypothetical protein [Vagococcus sp.]
MKKKRILSIILFTTILLYQVSVKAEEDILTDNTQMYGRLSSGVSRSITPNVFQFGDIIYNGEEKSVEKTAVGSTSVLGFYDRRGFILENRTQLIGSSAQIINVNNEEIEQLGVLEDGIPQITAVIEDVPDWLATTEISYTIKSNQVDKTDIESNEGTVPLSGEVVEPFAFTGEINMDNPNERHLSTDEKGYYVPGTILKQYTFSNVKLNLPAGIEVPPGKQTIDLKIKWNLVYTP